MLYCKDWDRIKKRYMEFWAKENHDRPLLNISILKDNPDEAPVSNHSSLKERWMDTDYIIRQANWKMRNTLYLGESFPALNPDLGPDYFAAAYGAEIEFGENTSWAKPFYSDDDVENYSGMIYNIRNEYYKKMDEITKAAVEDGRGKYLVGVTDLHPGADGLVSLRGPQELCFDVYDYPEFIQKGVMDMLPGFVKTYDHLQRLTTKYQEGTTCWMPIWHPGRWYVVGCDFSCMVSTDVYEEMLVKEIEMEIDSLDASIYHLDGPDALRHLDRILQIPKLNGVQWVYGAGQPTASHWLDVIKKIQAAGKCLYIDVSADELEFMLKNKDIRPEGVLYTVTGIHSEEEAKHLMDMAEKLKR